MTRRRAWALALALLLCAAPSVWAGWSEDLAAMPLPVNTRILDETNCVPLMLQAFHSSATVKALIFMPGATDELYFFQRVRAQLSGGRPTLAGAVAALTNQTHIRAAWRSPLLLLYNEEDQLEPDAALRDEPMADRIRSKRLTETLRFDDSDWAALQPMLARTLAVEIAPAPNAHESFHFFRHSFAAGNINGLELLRAVALAGKTRFRVEASRVVFESDTRHAAKVAPPTNFLATLMDPPCLVRAGEIALQNVKGGIGYFAADPASGRLFASAQQNNTIEIINVKNMVRMGQVLGIIQPRGVVFSTNAGRLIAACADSSVRVFDSSTYRESRGLGLGQNIGPMVQSGATILASWGAEQRPGVLSAIDLAFFDPLNAHSVKDSVLEQISLSTRPDSIQADTQRRRIYASMPQSGQIAVIETLSTNWFVSTNWTASGLSGPMALDLAGGRLFAACVNPPRIQAFDLSGARAPAQYPTGAEMGSLLYDPALKRLYAVCPEGFIDVYLLPGNDLEPAFFARTRAAPGVRSSLFIPELKTLAAAVPAGTNGPARILLFKTAE